MNQQENDLGVPLEDEGRSTAAICSEDLAGFPPPPSRERPILFSGAMVRAILEGRKTQTRRIVKPGKDIKFHPGAGPYVVVGYTGGFAAEMCNHSDTKTFLSLCPYGSPGDRLWVRETWNKEGANFHDDFAKPNPPYYYAADYDADANKLYTWRPSIFMPREACRIRLEVVSVRVERLQRISEPDARAEGVGEGPQEGWVTGPVVAYADLWDSINGRDAWLLNPWVWVVEFRRAEAFAQGIGASSPEPSEARTTADSPVTTKE